MNHLRPSLARQVDLNVRLAILAPVWLPLLIADSVVAHALRVRRLLVRGEAPRRYPTGRAGGDRADS